MAAVTGAPPRSAPHRYRPAAPVRGRGWGPDLLGSVAIASLLVVTALWVRDRGVQQLVAGGFGGITALGRITGLLSADLLLLQVLTMARVPWIERTYGQDRIARWHRWSGFTSFHLLIAHVVLITIGYAGADRTGLVREAWNLVTTYPGMLLATAGTALLTMVVVTSVRAARRRLRYESWHLLHLYAYLGAGLALPHQLWTGADFLDSGLATAYWWTAYGAVAGAVLVFRLGIPVWRNASHRLHVHAVVPEAPGVYSVYLHGRHLDRLPVRAGQFFTWRFLDGPGWTRANPYSLSAPPRGDILRITVKEQGDGSRRVAGLRHGTRVLVEGPFGRLTGAVRTSHRMTLIACGVGITPLRALLEEQPYRRGEAVLLYRARSADDLVFRKELDALAKARGIRLAYLVGPRAAANSWRPRGAPQLRELVPDIAGHDVFLCGPRQWMDAAARSARAAGVPDERIHLEEFGW